MCIYIYNKCVYLYMICIHLLFICLFSTSLLPPRDGEGRQSSPGRAEGRCDDVVDLHVYDICMYACMYVCMYVCICIYIYIYI